MIDEKRDLEKRHELGRKEMARRIDDLHLVTDDIQATRVKLAQIWLAEHYPGEIFSITPHKINFKGDFKLGFEVNHQFVGVSNIDVSCVRQELIEYFRSIGGFDEFR